MYQMILYGIAGADQQYIAQMYYCLYEEEISIYNIMYQARMLKAKCPSIEPVTRALTSFTRKLHSPLWKPKGKTKILLHRRLQLCTTTRI